MKVIVIVTLKMAVFIQLMAQLAAVPGWMDAVQTIFKQSAEQTEEVVVVESTFLEWLKAIGGR